MDCANNLSDILLQKGFCQRCILRFSKGATKQAEYLVDNALEDNNQDVNSKSFCGCCLAILDPTCLNTAISKISEIFKSKEYESSSFSLALSLPQSLILRQKSAVSFLNIEKKKLNDASYTTPVTVKDAVRYSLQTQVENNISKKHDSGSDLLINLVYKYDHDEKEISVLDDLLPNNNPKKRKFHQRYHNKNHHSKDHPTNSYQNIHNVLQNINDNDIVKFTQRPPQTLMKPCHIEVSVTQGSIFIAGRYNKFSRTLSQTPWLIDGERKTESSVQELICDNIQQHLNGKEVKFMSSGREDVDVRMLGSGRPFAAEIIDPQKISTTVSEMSRLQQQINKSTDQVAVRDLQIIDRDGLLKLKQGEEEKLKCYSAKIWCPDKVDDEKIERLNKMKKILLSQKTPLRVLHRRPPLTRERMVHRIEMARVDDHHYSIKLKTQAGTYIKEFVHSDFGRTTPSICSLLDANFDIIELDVDAVELDWPPTVDHDSNN